MKNVTERPCIPRAGIGLSRYAARAGPVLGTLATTGMTQVAGRAGGRTVTLTDLPPPAHSPSHSGWPGGAVAAAALAGGRSGLGLGLTRVTVTSVTVAVPESR